MILFNITITLLLAITCFLLLGRPTSSCLYYLWLYLHCGSCQFLTSTLFLCFSTRFTSHFAQRILCTMFHNSSRPLSFIILSSLSPSHPLILSLPCLFFSNSSSCPPPSPPPAALSIATATATSISTRLLPTDSQVGLCRRGRETNSRDLCHSAKFLENIWRVIKQLLSPAAVLVP